LPVAELAAVGAKLTLVTHPNAPTGTAFPLSDLRTLAEQAEGLVVFDEAYVDFGAESALPLVAERENVVVLRTMSKGFGLAGVRLGYAFGSRPVVDALYKIKDSYNVDRLTQVAGSAALASWDEAQRNNREIAARRDRLAEMLCRRYGWTVWPSAANFLLADPRPRAACEVYEGLKRRRILVRYFGTAPIENCLRISIGNEAEMAALVEALGGLLR
jgi:histidinol-phosphate aminotransferase